MKMIITRKSFPGLLVVMVVGLMGCGDTPSVGNTTETVNEMVAVDDTVDAPADHHIAGASKNTIKLALLLDTSSSMDGLIEQAKSQLWKIVNALSEAKKDGVYAELEIALYEYGNDNLKARNGYVRQILPFTTDLDTLSQELFALTTFGGSEYCGEVIAQSLSDLAWARETEGLQVIVIAGNEPFDQGSTSYRQVCENAATDGIFINTIYCGDESEGKETNWKDGADIALGYYGSIDMDEATVYIDTPFDEQINALNAALNETYLPVGSYGFNKNQAMYQQDQNASQYGLANETERVITKSKKDLYKNSTWDLVDASEEEGFDISKYKTGDLPEEMRDMSVSEKEAYVDDMKKEREEIQAKIKVLADKRAKYIAEKQSEMATNGESRLEDAIIKAIKEQARKRHFVFDGEAV